MNRTRRRSPCYPDEFKILDVRDEEMYSIAFDFGRRLRTVDGCKTSAEEWASIVAPIAVTSARGYYRDVTGRDPDHPDARRPLAGLVRGAVNLRWKDRRRECLGCPERLHGDLDGIPTGQSLGDRISNAPYGSTDEEKAQLYAGVAAVVAATRKVLDAYAERGEEEKLAAIAFTCSLEGTRRSVRARELAASDQRGASMNSWEVRLGRAADAHAPEILRQLMGDARVSGAMEPLKAQSEVRFAAAARTLFDEARARDEGDESETARGLARLIRYLESHPYSGDAVQALRIFARVDLDHCPAGAGQAKKVRLSVEHVAAFLSVATRDVWFRAQVARFEGDPLFDAYHLSEVIGQLRRYLETRATSSNAADLRGAP